MFFGLQTVYYMEVGTSVYYRSSECKAEKQIVALEIMLFMYSCFASDESEQVEC